MPTRSLVLLLLLAVPFAVCGCLRSSNNCGPGTCAGCCRDGKCLEAHALSACGIGGEFCKTCQSSGEACVDGFCVASCGAQGDPCSGSACCGGLECRSGQCQPPVACAQSGKACSNTLDCCEGLGCAASSGTCQPCGQPGQTCCGRGQDCVDGFWCANGATCSPYFADTGKTCAKNSDCSQSLCLPLPDGRNACTIPCASTDRCLGGWECKPLTGVEGQVCQCAPKAEECNGKDDDCNQWVDDGFMNSDCEKKIPNSVCKAGACVCPEGLTECAGRCVDLASNDEHCGSCGKSCLGTVGDAGYPASRGAGCFASACRTWEQFVDHGLRGYGTLLVADGVLWMTVNGSSYYPPLGTLESCPTTGCAGSPQVRLSGLEGPRQMAAWAGDLYFATELGVERYSPATGKHVVLAPEVGAAGGLAVSNGTLVWASLSRSGADCALKKCSLPACLDTVSLLTGACAYGHLAADATHVYWSGRAAGDAGTDTVQRCSLAGCPGGSQWVAQGGGEIAVDGTDVYWTDMSANAVLRCPVAGCATPTVLSDKTHWPWGLALDGNDLYWTDDGHVLRCPKSGCPAGGPEHLARTGWSDGGEMLVVDSTSVFWSTDYRVWKAAK